MGEKLAQSSLSLDAADPSVASNTLTWKCRSAAHQPKKTPGAAGGAGRARRVPPPPTPHRRRSPPPRRSAVGHGAVAVATGGPSHWLAIRDAADVQAARSRGEFHGGRKWGKNGKGGWGVCFAKTLQFKIIIILDG